MTNMARKTVYQIIQYTERGTTVIEATTDMEIVKNTIAATKYNCYPGDVVKIEINIIK
jgi:hypothetical protein